MRSTFARVTPQIPEQPQCPSEPQAVHLTVRVISTPRRDRAYVVEIRLDPIHPVRCVGAQEGKASRFGEVHEVGSVTRLGRGELEARGQLFQSEFANRLRQSEARFVSDRSRRQYQAVIDE